MEKVKKLQVNEKLVQINSFDNPLDANMFKSKLESEGIECFLPDENTVSANMFLSTAVGNIKVMIKESDYEKAQKVISDYKSELNIIEETYDDGYSDKHHGASCPKCESASVNLYRHNRKGAAISILLLGFPLIFTSKEWKCDTCGYSWVEKRPFAVNAVRLIMYSVFLFVIISIVYEVFQ